MRLALRGMIAALAAAEREVEIQAAVDEVMAAGPSAPFDIADHPLRCAGASELLGMLSVFDEQPEAPVIEG